MLLLRSWRWRTTLDCEMQGLPVILWELATHWICLYCLKYDLRIHGFRPSWLSKFFQPERNFLNHLDTLLWSTAQQMFLVSSAVLWSISNSLSSWIRLHCIFVVFKSYMEWSGAQCISAPTITTILSTTSGTFPSWTAFGPMIYVLQTRMYQNIAKLLTHSNILKNLWDNEITWLFLCFCWNAQYEKICT